MNLRQDIFVVLGILFIGIGLVVAQTKQSEADSSETAEVEETKSERKYAKIEFTDISWYKKLGTTLWSKFCEGYRL